MTPHIEEDAHQSNDLSLLELFKHQTIILGVIGIARSRIESVDEIASRLRQAMDRIDNSRLIWNFEREPRADVLIRLCKKDI